MARKIGIILVVVLLISGAVVFALRHQQPAVESDNAGAGKEIPDLELVDLEAKPVKLRDLLKAKPKALINMWATWCEPCVHEMPLIVKARERLAGENTQVILINYNGGNAEKTIPEVKAWLVSQNLNIVTYFDLKEDLIRGFQIGSLPYTLAVVDAMSTPHLKWGETGELNWTDSKVRVE